MCSSSTKKYSPPAKPSATKRSASSSRESKKVRLFPAIAFDRLLTADFNYLALVELFDKLRATPEAHQKNLFGQFTAKSIKDVSSLVSLLEKKNLHLADVGKELSHLVNFEG